LDRFLEHTRVFHFLNDGHSETWLSSADLMTRNLDHRVELAFPLMDPLLAEQVLDMMELQLHDTVKGRVLGPDGSVIRRGLDATGETLRSQIRLFEHARLQSGATSVTQKLPDLI
jgi:polyphosphate kinase